MSELNFVETQAETESNDRNLCLKTDLIGSKLFNHLKEVMGFKFLHSTLIHI